MSPMPNCQHCFLSSIKCSSLQKVSLFGVLYDFIQFSNHYFIVAVTFSVSQEVEKENSILVPPGEEKETERAELPVCTW